MDTAITDATTLWGILKSDASQEDKRGAWLRLEALFWYDAHVRGLPLSALDREEWQEVYEVITILNLRRTTK